MNRPSNHVVPLLYTALACGGLLFAVVGGSNAAVVAVGLTIAAVAGTTGAIAWRRAAPVGRTVSTRGWWKLVVAGPALIGAVIVAAGLGVDAWIVGMLAVLVAFVVTGLGLLLGIVRLLGRSSRAMPT